MIEEKKRRFKPSKQPKQKESDENTASELANIQREIEDGKEAMQDAVATKVLDQIKPVTLLCS